MILQSTGFSTADPTHAENIIRSSSLIVDALIGYSLKGPPHGQVAHYINIANQSNVPVLSLDLPSGMNATTGETAGDCIEADMTLTLALPKTGLRAIDHTLYLADIGIPRQLYQAFDLEVPPFPSSHYFIEITHK
jgi:NAD(P)H-hydrate epimerase